MKKDINIKLEQVKDELEKIVINSEMIENYNKLICDKLEEIGKLDLTKDLLIQLYQIKRYSECYLALNLSIKQETDKINDSAIKINKLLEACTNDD